MVSIQKQIIIGVKDVVIQFKCECGAAMVLNPDKPIDTTISLENNREKKASLPPERCPQCSAVWFPDNRKIRAMLEALKEVRQHNGAVSVEFVASAPSTP